MTKRRYSALAVLALAAAAVFAGPASSASAASATTSNACANSVTANFSQIGVTTSGTDGIDLPATVAPAGTTTTTGLSQSAAIPGAIFVAGYNLGLLVQGTNNVPANVRSTIEATNTVQGQQLTNVVGGTPPNGTVAVTTVITDPDGTPGTGDETATDASFSVTYNNLTWTAGASGTIDYRQQSIATAPPTAANNALLINALVGGVFNVQFRCAPGTVTPPDPGIITLIDPAGSFDTTTIQPPPVNQAPTANAGADQTVASGATVNLTGAGSTDPDGDTLTYAWTQTGGTAVTLTGANTATPSFTAPTLAPGDPPATLTFQLEVCDPAPLCDTDTVVVTVNPPPPVNQAPTANAGADQTVASGATVNLTGAGSTDPDGDTLTYAWTQTGGTAVTLTGANTATPSFTAPTLAPGDPPATLTFQLEVCDPAPLCDTDTVVVTVNPPPPVNQAPTANAGADQTVASGATVNLTGAGSTDPDGDTLTYAWTQTGGTAVTLTGANTATPSFTAPTLAPGDPPATLTFQLEVCDPAPLCDTDTVVVTVNPPSPVNQAPTANAGADQTVASGATVNLTGAGSTDPDGDTLTYAWTQTGGTAVTLTGANTATPSFTAPTLAPGDPPATLTFQLEVCDPAPLCDTDTVVVTVNPPSPVNQAPTANAGADQTVASGATVNLTGAGSTDPDGDTLTYAWTQTGGTAVTLTGANTATPSFTAPTLAPGDPPATLTFQLEVCDPAPLCDTDTVVVTVNPPSPVNQAPTANAGADQTVASGATVNLTGAGSTDPDGDTLTYAWTQTGGTAVTLTGANTATPSFTAPTLAPGDPAATLTFQLEVCDPAPLCDTDTVVVTVQPPVTEAVDAAGEIKVSGPVQAKKDSKKFSFRVTNLGDSPITVDPTIDIDASVEVNGTPNGSVNPLTGTKTIAPGDSAKFKFSWDGDIAPGDAVEFTACVNLAGDVNPANNCDSETRTAVGKGHDGHCDKDHGEGHHH